MKLQPAIARAAAAVMVSSVTAHRSPTGTQELLALLGVLRHPAAVTPTSMTGQKQVHHLVQVPLMNRSRSNVYHRGRSELQVGCN